MIGQNPAFSVSEFVAVFNQSIEMMYPQVAIIGEMANFRVSNGRWVYFDLKDEGASVKFFGTVYKLPGPMEDGIICEVTGRPYLHNLYGFSVQISAIRPIGEGSLKRAQDLLLKKLEAEGLFEESRKRGLAYPPVSIGLITSAESAAIADFKKIISARWPSLEIELIDTLVQGAGAPTAIIEAIHEFNMRSNQPEVLVIIRGGGSPEDLAAFSDERVVRAVAASRIPTMVAIGHENDISLAELAADRRASTPSNAAELLVPDMWHERDIITNYGRELDAAFKDLVKDEKRFLADSFQRLEDILHSAFIQQEQDLANKRMLLQALSPYSPLQQGYALVRDAGGRHIRKAGQLRKSKLFSLEFTDGKLQARVSEDEQL